MTTVSMMHFTTKIYVHLVGLMAHKDGQPRVHPFRQVARPLFRVLLLVTGS